jgi:transposase
MAAGLSLARPTRRRLVRLDRKARDADLRIRCRVVLKVAEGMSCAEAARALSCAPSTAARIVARFRWQGEVGLIDGRSDNGARKVDADVRAGIVAILARRAPAGASPGRPGPWKRSRT